MKHLSYETLRRIMEDRIASRYRDAAIKAAREAACKKIENGCIYGSMTLVSLEEV